MFTQGDHLQKIATQPHATLKEQERQLISMMRSLSEELEFKDPVVQAVMGRFYTLQAEIGRLKQEPQDIHWPIGGQLHIVGDDAHITYDFETKEWYDTLLDDDHPQKHKAGWLSSQLAVCGEHILRVVARNGVIEVAALCGVTGDEIDRLPVPIEHCTSDFVHHAWTADLQF